MKPSFEYVQLGDASSIKVKTYVRKKIRVPFHYHPEHEIVLVLKGSGKVMVSDAATTYAKGELFLIGGSVPHLFIDDKHGNRTRTGSSKVLVIQFKEDLFKNLLHLPEFHNTGLFLAKIRHGVKVSKLSGLQQLVSAINHAKGVDKFSILTRMLDRIERKGGYQLIAQGVQSAAAGMSSQRLQLVHSFLANNYSREDITIDEVARAVHLSKTSLCRFLKKETQKTFSEHLNEIRIQSACRLLRETPATITQICYEVGFSSLSYFYRQFKKLRQLSPHDYQRQYAL